MGNRPQAMIDLAKLLEEAVEHDLEDIRAEIKREEEEFLEHHDDHNRYLRSLTILEGCMAARLGQPSMYSDETVDRLMDAFKFIKQAGCQDANQVPIDVVVTLDKPEQSKPKPVQAKPDELEPAQSKPELPASGEILLDDPEPAVEEDDHRSIEERIRDLLAKVGSRSARQIGAQIAVEKSVVYAALHGSKWFRMERGNDELPEHNRPWQLTAAGER